MSACDDPPTCGLRRSRPERVTKTWGGLASSRQARLATAALIALTLALPGCAVVTVVGVAAGAAIAVTGAVVGTTVTVAGKLIGKTIYVVTPGGPPQP